MRLRSENDRGLYIPAWVWIVAALTVVLGVIGLVLGFKFAQLDTWLWLIVTFLVFSGITNGMLVCSAVFRVAQARWTPAITRIGQSSLAFVPVLVVLLAVLLIGIPNYEPWVAKPVPLKSAWLNIPFMVIRDSVSLGIFWLLCFVMVRWSLIADKKQSRGEEITSNDHSRLNSIAVAVVMMYSVASSIVAMDFIMALSPKWVSTVFPPYYFCTNFYIGLGAIVLLVTVFRKSLHVEEHTKPQQFQDMGNLMLAFALFNMGLFFAQYLTIWYENLHDESGFLLVRYMYGPWPKLSWTAFIVAYGLPFLILQSRYVKQKSKLISTVVVIAMLGITAERYTLVVPSLRPAHLVIFLPAALVFLAVLSLFVISVMLFLMRYSPISAADEALRSEHQKVEL